MDTLEVVLTYNVADGIMLGSIVYVLINALTGKVKDISAMMWVLAVLFVLKYLTA